MNVSPKALSVLVVEDDSRDADLLAIALAQSARPMFRVTRAMTLAEAVGVLRGGAAVDIVMLDLSLPDAHGADTVRGVRQAAPDLPIVVMTGDDDVENAERILTLGAQDYLWKGDATASSIARAVRYAITRMQQMVERSAMLARSEALARDVEVGRNRLARFLDCVPQHVAVLDREGRIIMVNQAWRQFAAENGGAEDFFVGHSYLGACQPGGSEFARGVAAVLNGDSKVFAMEYPCHSPDRQRWFKVDVSSLTGGEGGAVVAHTDITEHHRVELELRDSLDAKNRLVGVLAHDLRNPLGAIGGYAEFAEMTEGGLSEMGKSALGTIRESVAYMDALIEDVLALAVVDANEIKLVRQRIDLAAIARRAAAVGRGAAERKGIELVIEAAPTWTEGDAVKIEQVLNNLIGNAVKFSHAGSAVKVSAAIRDDVVCVTVADEGTGIPPQVMASLFKPFAKGQQGTAGERSNGLGLYICMRIIEAHGGRIVVDSEPGRGTLFTVVLPVV